MGRGWLATVHEVPKSQTLLSNTAMYIYIHICMCVYIYIYKTQSHFAIYLNYCKLTILQ